MKHISGKTLNFTNNQGNIITPSFIKTINNYGFIRENHTGNLIISFNIIFPPTLSVKQIADINNIL
jgi:DnaJ-class molecular chaperone